MSDTVIEIDNLKKKYRLGAIGGGTLTADLQSWWARVRGKEDPNSKIGSNIYSKNEVFMALKGINLEIYKGETVGIIGGNGAGKSTMLKILSRVTAPTEGTIKIQGRISSLLEVGTGFHGELTGRENIYLNGAILGMTKEEVDSKINDIIEFSECGQFIDTPVKRYSSGMFVKLAFSVAAHLDSEILIMDEVLAVGDMKFQEKCINKMRQLSKEEGRTILYVSHNMTTIRQLCDRCIVLHKGKVIYNGNVEKAISIYLDKNNKLDKYNEIVKNDNQLEDYKCKLLSTLILDTENNIFDVDSKIRFRLKWKSKEQIEKLYFRCVLFYEESPIGITFSDTFTSNLGENIKDFEIDTKGLSPGIYCCKIILSINRSLGFVENLDSVEKAINFEIIPNDGYCDDIEWNHKYWGFFKLNNIKVLD